MPARDWHFPRQSHDPGYPIADCPQGQQSQLGQTQEPDFGNYVQQSVGQERHLHERNMSTRGRESFRRSPACRAQTQVNINPRRDVFLEFGGLHERDLGRHVQPHSADPFNGSGDLWQKGPVREDAHPERAARLSTTVDIFNFCGKSPWRRTRNVHRQATLPRQFLCRVS